MGRTRTRSPAGSARLERERRAGPKRKKSECTGGTTERVKSEWFGMHDGFFSDAEKKSGRYCRVCRSSKKSSERMQMIRRWL